MTMHAEKWKKYVFVIIERKHEKNIKRGMIRRRRMIERRRRRINKKIDTKRKSEGNWMKKKMDKRRTD